MPQKKAKHKTEDRKRVEQHLKPAEKLEETDPLAGQRTISRLDTPSLVDIKTLQKTYGNRMVMRLLSRGESSLIQADRHFGVIQRLSADDAADAVYNKGGKGLICFIYAAAVMLAQKRWFKFLVAKDVMKALSAGLDNATVAGWFEGGTSIATLDQFKSVPPGSFIGIDYRGASFGLSSHVMVKTGGTGARGTNNPGDAQPDPSTTVAMQDYAFNGDGSLGGSLQVTAMSYLDAETVRNSIEGRIAEISESVKAAKAREGSS